MRNSDHPLIKALKSKGKIPPTDNIRLFEIKKEDIHPMARPDIGDNLHMSVRGRVKARGDDGAMTLHVEKVDHHFPDEEVAQASEPIIRTQQSHVP